MKAYPKYYRWQTPERKIIRACCKKSYVSLLVETLSAILSTTNTP